MIVRFLLAAFLVAQLGGLVACNSKSKGVEACVERGVQYYKDIGSYPALSDGRSAVDVVKERCGRTSTAF